MERSLYFFFWIVFLFLRPCGNQAHENYTWFQGHPGFQVLISASHYWPLEMVNGIHELRQPSKGTTGPDNASDTNILEGTVNKGIYLNEQNGKSLLYFGNSKNSCIINPSVCGPEGVTFSFFWKIHDQQKREQQQKKHNYQNQQEQSQSGGQKPRQAEAYGNKVTSNGFEIYSDESKGYVEIYNREKSKVWKASITPPGPYWTHILLTWTSGDGLRIYMNGTFNASDSRGHVFHSYGDGNDSLVVGTNRDSSKHYVNRAFDEFIIWERALTPDEIYLYFTLATGAENFFTSTISSSLSTSHPTVSTDAYYPILTNLSEENRKFPHTEPVLGYLEIVSQILPNISLPLDTAGNLTQAFLKTVEEVLLLPTWNDMSSVSSCLKAVGQR